MSTLPPAASKRPNGPPIFYVSTGQLSQVLAPVLQRSGAAPLVLSDERASLARPAVVVVAVSYVQSHPERIRGLLTESTDESPIRFIIIEDALGPTEAIPPELIFGYIGENVSQRQLLTCIHRACEFSGMKSEARQLRGNLERRSIELKELNQIGVALSVERDVDTLLSLILQRSRAITNADAGSLLLVEEPIEGQKQLRFKLAQNDSLEVGYREFVMPLSRSSIAGFVTLSGRSLRIDDVYQISQEAEYGFNRSFDEKTGYRTKSMMTVAMRNHADEIVGAIQLINRKRDAEVKLTSHEVVEEQVIPFTKYSEELVSSLASQAAVAMENNNLLIEIEHLFEGFVNASVLAIEQRDPTTQGHSKRVAVYTVGLADALEHVKNGPYGDLKFTSQQIKEIRYASLLHDVGKIGVRENVLVKAKKLYDEKLLLIEDRFRIAREVLTRETTRRKMEYMEKSREDFAISVNRLDQQFVDELKVIDEYFEMIKVANEPQILASEVGSGLRDIAQRTFFDLAGTPFGLLQEEEIRILSIPKGSLSEEERREIESHVTKSFNFLKTIPWTKDLRGIPSIAHAHHEKLDGSGYPRGIKVDEIPVQAKMMTISDIYDALTAADRPYKKAVPLTRALDILTDEAKRGFVDAELLRIFVEAKIYEQVHP